MAMTPRRLPSRWPLVLLVLLLTVGGTVPAQQTGEAKLGTPITSLPYTISSPGVYVLNQDFLSLNLASGTAITVSASDVVLDLNGHTLSNVVAGAGTTAFGVYASDQSNVTVRHGTLQGFMTGVAITASDLSNPGATSYGHLVERLNVNACTYEGVSVAAGDSTVRSCQVENIGGSSALDQLASAYGIDFLGTGLRCLDCDVSTVTASGMDGVSYAIYVSSTNDAFALNNRLSAAQYGLYFDGAAGQYRHNLATGMLLQSYVGGTDAGQNIVDSNNDGIDDDWELQYFGTLNVNLNAPAPNGEGLTILQAYQQGINPVDYYSGQTPPRLSIVSGNGQSAAPTSFLPAPLVVQVNDANGNPMAGAPVTFSVASGGGQLQATRQASSKTTVNVLTDANGQAKVFFQVSSIVGVTSSINVILPGTNSSIVSSFQETADGNGPTNPTPVDPGNPPGPQPVPVQSYAAINVSGEVTPAYGSLRLDDDNAVTFWTSADDGGSSSSAFDNGPFSAYVWKDGVLGAPQVTPGTVSGSSDPSIAPYAMPVTPSCVLPSGELVGMCGYSDLPALGYTTGLCFANGSDVTTAFPPLFTIYGQPGYPESPVAVATLASVADNGTVAGRVTYDYNGFCYLYFAGTFTAFDADPDDPEYALPPAGGGWVQVVTEPLAFDQISAVNSSGQALGNHSMATASGVYTDYAVYWDGAHMAPVGPGYAAGLNEQAQAIVRGLYDQTSNTEAEGYLWESGSGATTVLADHLPAELAGQITQIEPLSLSNQTAPGTDATIYILATANVTQADGTVTQGATIVCSRDNEGDWSFAQVKPPDGTTISQYTTINSSGVIAVIGNLSSGANQNQANGTILSDPATPSDNQAGLLSAISLTAQVQPGPATFSDDATSNMAGYATLKCPSVTVTATLNKAFVKQKIPSANQLKIVQDATGTATIAYQSDGHGESSTTCAVTIASNGQATLDPHPDGFLADDDPRFRNGYGTDTSGNLICQLSDSPFICIGYLPRQQVKSLSYNPALRDYVQIPNADGTATTVKEVDWSMSMSVTFDRNGMDTGIGGAGKPTAIPTDLPSGGKVKRGADFVHKPVPPPRAPTANTFINTTTNWTPTGAAGSYAFRPGFNPFIPLHP